MIDAGWVRSIQPLFPPNSVGITVSLAGSLWGLLSTVLLQNLHNSLIMKQARRL